jgi:hypothetical protein
VRRPGRDDASNDNDEPILYLLVVTVKLGRIAILPSLTVITLLLLLYHSHVIAVGSIEYIGTFSPSLMSREYIKSTMRSDCEPKLQDYC